jgi:hypothetical protein
MAKMDANERKMDADKEIMARMEAKLDSNQERMDAKMDYNQEKTEMAIRTAI